MHQVLNLWFFRSCNQTSADSTVRVLSVSRFCLDFPENPVCCLSAVRILSRFSVRCLSVRILSVSILSGFSKKKILSRPDKDKTELPGLSLSLSADVVAISAKYSSRTFISTKFKSVVQVDRYVLNGLKMNKIGFEKFIVLTLAGFRPYSEIIGKFRKLKKLYDYSVKRQKWRIQTIFWGVSVF